MGKPIRSARKGRAPGGGLCVFNTNRSRIMKTKYIFALTIMLVVGGFYWFQLRPANIKKECWSRVEKMQSSGSGGRLSGSESSILEYRRIIRGDQESVDDYYKNCLREKGL